MLLAALAVVGATAGCGGENSDGAPLHDPSGDAFQPAEATTADFAAADGTRADALHLLDSLRRGAFNEAFGRLDSLGYRRSVRTAQIGADGHPVASEERVMRHVPGGGEGRVLRRDSSGRFAFGPVGGLFTGDENATGPSGDLARQVLAEEPAFLSERNRYAFQYRLLPDTTLHGRTTRVVAVRAGPEGEKQAIRRARLYIDARTRELVGVRLRQVRHSLLFDEDTRQFVRLRPAPPRSSGTARDSASAWVPDRTRFDTRLDLPLRPERRFRSTASYDEFHAPAS